MKICSVAHVGLSTVPVTVEVDVAGSGFPGMTIVGLAGKTVEEARDRVKTAIVNSGFEFPAKKITINLAPADLPKEGGAYDLPMAVGVLMASQKLKVLDRWKEAVFYGELSLDGELRTTKGVLLAAMWAVDQGKALFVPKLSAVEAGAVTNAEVYPVTDLAGLVEHLMGLRELSKLKHIEAGRLVAEAEPEFDLAEIVGQEMAKRALAIAACGGHNLLFWGPPGTGKTMLARSMPGIMPLMQASEALEVTRVYSAAGLIPEGQSLVRRRPFRSPHHGISPAGMIGGGSNPVPGEVSLAHLGVLFLDEMTQFPRTVIEALRQPLEDRCVEVVRVKSRVSYPAGFTLIGAVNPCPCGYLGHPRKECRCTPTQVTKYRQRISGPIWDRIDMYVNVPAVDTEKLTTSGQSGESTETVKVRVENARQIQIRRFAAESGVYANSQMKNRQVKKYALLENEAEKLLKLAIDKFDLSARAYFKIIKVARTIADLDNSEKIKGNHMAEAIVYRQLNW